LVLMIFCWLVTLRSLSKVYLFFRQVLGFILTTTTNTTIVYRIYRPRESLGFLTPAEHSAMLGMPIPKRVSVL